MIQGTSGIECLIVGGGVVGLSLAFELASRGRRVQIVDQQELGRAASWAGAGILPPSPTQAAVDPLEQLRGLSHALHPQWAARLRQLTGVDTGFRPCGGLYLARTRAEAATLAANHQWWQTHGIVANKLSGWQLVDREPALRHLVAANPEIQGWFLPGECQLRNPWHLQALTAACQKLKVVVSPHTATRRICVEGGRVRGVETTAGFLAAQQVCVCAGAWSRLLLDELKVTNGIMPVRGQMLLYRCQHPWLTHVVNDGNRYLVQREDGRLLAGSCEEEAGFDCRTTDLMLAELKEWSCSILPQLSSCEIERSWAGLRPGSYDGMPYMGPVGGVPNLFVASGHFRAGLHLSCGTAVVMADLMQGRIPPIDLTSFRASRG